MTDESTGWLILRRGLVLGGFGIAREFGNRLYDVRRVVGGSVLAVRLILWRLGVRGLLNKSG
ncbi:MAG: hypothetical protein ACO4B6_06530, partial [Ilumatobacteraceae bacterium]